MNTIKNLNMIVAMTSKNNAIGKDNKMLFHIPEDLRYFKNITRNNSIILGYNTYLSLPVRPLPERTNIVLSRKRKSIDNVVVFDSIEKVLEYVKEKEDEIFFVCGGDSIYKQFLSYASKLYITKIEKESSADTFFPKFNEEEYKIIFNEKGNECENIGIDYSFIVYEKI